MDVNVQLFKGGEDEGLTQLARISKRLYQNEITEDSFRISPWLSSGSLSPKMAYWYLNDLDLPRKQKQFIEKFYRDLMVRDHFRFLSKKYGDKIFQAGGIYSHQVRTRNLDPNNLDSWVHGLTGMPYVDACMRELSVTGYIDFRKRKIVASFFLNELGLFWILGAEYFESILVDYDPCSNYVNWANIAGLGVSTSSDKPLSAINQGRLMIRQGII